MATQPMPALDSPPPSPPSVTAQQAPNPLQAIGGSMAQNMQQQQGSDQDYLLTRASAITKVLDEMGRKSKEFAPIADRIKQLLQMGIGKAVSGPGQGSSQPRSVPGSARPDEGSSFPG